MLFIQVKAVGIVCILTVAALKKMVGLFKQDWMGLCMDSDVMGRLWKWAANTRKGHKRKGFEIQISRNEVYYMAVEAMKTGCYFCGCELVLAKSGDSKCVLPDQVSLDVVNPKHRVLEKGNCRVICCSCNGGRMAMSEADYVAKCLRVVENMTGVKV